MTRSKKEKIAAIVTWVLIVLIVAALAWLSLGCATQRQPLQPLSIRRELPPPMAAPAAAAQPTKTVTLVWDPPVSGPVSYYRIYQGGQSRDYTNSISMITSNSQMVGGLIPKATYYFAATAINVNGPSESEYSNEVSYRVPASRARLTTQSTLKLETGNWKSIATNYDETTNLSGFYRILIDYEE